MYILGINGGVRIGYRDASAVLLHNGQIVAAAEEERFNRIKASPSQLPELSVRFVLDQAGITMEDVAAVATHGSTWGNDYESVLKNYLLTNFGYAPSILRFHHHDCHAAGAYFASGFEEAVILSIDNSGDGISTQIALGKAENIDILERIARPNSLGLFYGMITQFCGFQRDSDEYKLMGLAPYGKPDIDLSDILRIDGPHYLLSHEYLQPIVPGQPQPSLQQAIYSDKLTHLLGHRRLTGAPMQQHYMDIAASAQKLLEEVICNMVREAVLLTGVRKVCLAGGVALNCAANKAILEMPEVEDLFVQPAAGDAGISQGAAYLGCLEMGVRPQSMPHSYWGQSFSEDEIRKAFLQTGVRHQEVTHPAETAAALVAQGKVVAWHQGRFEFGPRALGNRSILANPAIPDIKHLVNHKIKFRESFRPFCPSVLEEDAPRFFKGKCSKAPYMTINFAAQDITRNALNGIVHVDGTSRIQTVSEQSNPLFHAYLSALKQHTSYGVSINTSFNVNQQPIVNTPLEAIATMYGSGIDAMIIGPYLAEKSSK